MRHRKLHTKLNRKTGPRKALLRNLAVALIDHGRIRTTEAKAKALRPFIERLVTLGKRGEQHHRRHAFAHLGKKHAVHKVFTEIAPLFKERGEIPERRGGYTRIIHDGQRMGDGSWMAYIEFVDFPAPVAEPAKPEAEAAKA